MTNMKIVVGGTVEDDAADFLDAWKRGQPGERPLDQRILGFQSWDGLSSVLTGDRLRVLRRVHDHPDLSIEALSQALGRPGIGVHADLTALESMGLVHLFDGGPRASVERITVEIRP